jgi:hypothetical protein
MRSVIMLGLVGVMGLTGVGGASAATNLVVNGSFEVALGDNGLPKGWELGGEPADAFKASVVPGGRTGAKALQLEGAGKWGVVAANRVELDRSLRYTARGYFKVEGPEAQATIKFDFTDDQGNYVGSTDYGALGLGPGGWRLINIPDRSRDFPKAKALRVCLVLLGKGKAIFDDIELTADTAPAASVNLLSNGNMECLLGEKVAGYWTGSNEGGKYEWSASAVNPKEGRSCLHVKGSGEWSGADCEKIKREKGKTYTLTGWVRVQSGEAHIKLNGLKDDHWLDHVISENVSGHAWQQLTVTLDPASLPEATYLSACVAGLGDADVDFDDLVLTAK